MVRRSVLCVTTYKDAARTLLSSTQQTGSATALVLLLARRSRSRRDHSFTANPKKALYSIPRLRIQSPTGGQSVSSCAITSNVDRHCDVRERTARHSRSTPLIICWLWMISAASARFVFATRTTCFSAQTEKDAGRLRHSSSLGICLAHRAPSRPIQRQRRIWRICVGVVRHLAECVLSARSLTKMAHFPLASFRASRTSA